MTPEAKVTLATWVGGRAAHRFLSNLFHQSFFEPYPNNPLPKQILRDSLQQARYYGWANFLRGAIYIPVIVALFRYQESISLYVLLALVAFHAFCIWGEVFKIVSISRQLHAEFFTLEVPEVRDPPPDPDEHPYFTPLPFESEPLYLKLGTEAFRLRMVVPFIENTELTPYERRNGFKTVPIDTTRTGLVGYETQTRQAEIMHILAGSLNLLPAYSFFRNEAYIWLAYVGLIVFLDFELIMLQRYHRVRITKLLKKMGSSRTRSVEQVPTNP